MTRKPTTTAEMAAVADAEDEVSDAGFTPEPTYSYITDIPGVGAQAFAFSYETIPGTNGHPAAEGIATVQEST